MDRTLEQVQNEHNQTAFQLGIETYRIKCAEENIKKLLDKMLILNEEGAKLMKEKENESKSSAGNQPEEKVVAPIGEVAPAQEAVPSP